MRKGLCKRLLGSEKEFNEAHEQTFISKLKERCGNNYTRHLQGMFADINDAASKASVTSLRFILCAAGMFVCVFVCV